LTSQQDKAYQHYLLGIANEEEETHVEERVLSGEVDAQFLQAMEDQLIDDYLQKKLDPQEERGFEDWFLLDEERRLRLSFASSLLEYCKHAPNDEVPPGPKVVPIRQTTAALLWKRTALLGMAASVLFAVLAGFALVELRSQREIAQTASSQGRSSEDARPAAMQASRAPNGEPANDLAADELATNHVFSIDLAPTAREGTTKVFHVLADAPWARIDWEFSAPSAERYRELLLSSTGEQIWAEEFPASALVGAKRSTMILPASLLPPGTYHLQIHSLRATGQSQELADAVFHVAW
jgi:hypothetical protein